MWRLICNLRFFTIRVPYGRPISPIRPLFSCHGSFICFGCKSGIPSGRLLSLTRIPSSRLMSVSREGRDLWLISPSLPFGTGVPSCPLDGEPEAGFFVRGLFGSSSELSWQRPLFVLTFSAADVSGEAIDCSGVVCGGGVSSEEGVTRGTGFSGVISSNVSNRVRQ